jgi:hypothetical protein
LSCRVKVAQPDLVNGLPGLATGPLRGRLGERSRGQRTLRCTRSGGT